MTRIDNLINRTPGWVLFVLLAGLCVLVWFLDDKPTLAELAKGTSGFLY